jgi:hypothetical protein
VNRAILALLVCIGITAYSQEVDMDEVITRSEMAMMQMQGLIPMRFANALNGMPIPNAQVEIPGIGTFVTNSKGIISFPQQADGYYSMTVSKEGFITTPIDFQIRVSTVVFNWFSISPILRGDFRMVLDWGERPEDLDLHFEKEKGYHISWRNMQSAADKSAKLDRDDRTGYGPETITVERAEPSAAYSLYVIDYTNQRNRSSRALGQSGAVVRIYSNNRLLNTFTVPSGQGNRWNVCTIIQGAIVPVNTLTN